MASEGAKTKKTVLALVVLAIAGLGMYLSYWNGWGEGYSKGHTAGYRLAVEDAKAAAPPPVQHHYRFERNGASLWRYDDATGEACQIESNVTDAWIGGHCPPPAQ